MERDLKQAEENFERIFNLSPVRMGIIRCRDGMIMAVNDRLIRDVGYTREETVGHTIFEFDQQFSPELRLRIKQLLKEGSPIRDLEARIWTKVGEERLIITSAEGVEFENEPCFLWATDDITERARAESELTASREQLRALTRRVQSAREEEGTRIAREIHDVLGSSLTGLKWDLEAISKTLSRTGDGEGFEAVRNRIPVMSKQIDSTIDVVRRISSELRPSVLDDLGLAAAIEWQSQQFQQRTGIVCQCESTFDPQDLGRERATAVFRIFQEVLTNVLRHSQATRVVVEMSANDDVFSLKVDDNGRGITEAQVNNPASLGLLGIRERAHLIGGEVSVTGKNGEGTAVIVRLPLK
jgi:PAS domain S-box-containing protein